MNDNNNNEGNCPTFLYFFSSKKTYKSYYYSITNIHFFYLTDSYSSFISQTNYFKIINKHFQDYKCTFLKL